MREEEMVAELKDQGVTAVKRFTKKQNDRIHKTNTYLFTFDLQKIPKSLKAGYFNIRVEVDVPNPLQCFTCQKFGHGAKFYIRNTICVRCGGALESSDCTTDSIKCANSEGDHAASSKVCAINAHE
ncbi:uncharacterized protein [Haliotis cracherodii]|uniref:uncharacterized protein n=1 Tax=Haliotis cracherodii TaxID=6455 RepID=UPI0039ED3D2B